MVITSTMSFAQLRADFGMKAGWNVTGLELNSGGKLVGLTYNNRSGYHIGGYASFRFKKFAVQPELIYSRQGQNFTTPNYSNLNSDLKYINIPVIIKYYLVGGLNLQVGPQFGFLASAKGDLMQVDNAGNISATTRGQDLKSYLKGTDLSIGIGAGIDIHRVNLTIRYNIGVSDINTHSGSSYPNGVQPSFSTAKTQNQVVQFSVGYRFYKIGK
ncbi:MAG: porin family protein [Cyclobacteriaceae bacterium]